MVFFPSVSPNWLSNVLLWFNWTVFFCSFLLHVIWCLFFWLAALLEITVVSLAYEQLALSFCFVFYYFWSYYLEVGCVRLKRNLLLAELKAGRSHKSDSCAWVITQSKTESPYTFSTQYFGHFFAGILSLGCILWPWLISPSVAVVSRVWHVGLCLHKRVAYQQV